MNCRWAFIDRCADVDGDLEDERDRQQPDRSNGWHIIYQPLGFIIFFVCALAECNRTPFDLPEAENELNFGYHQEYSSMKLGFYLFAEYINMFISSVVMATLYFGGYDIPFVNEASWGLNQNLMALIGFCGVDGQSIFFHICIYVDPLDNSTFPL